MKQYEIYNIHPLTPEQVIEQLEIADREDQEEGHIRADDALCGLLLTYGFEDIVEKYCNLPKWYA